MMSAPEKRALKALCGKRAKPELKALFALVRAHDDRALFAALAPARKTTKRRARDPLLADVEASLRPIMAPAAEKAELLAEQLAKTHRRKLNFTSRGLADTVRRLRAAGFNDGQIRSGAKTLIARLATLYDGRETVV